MARSFGFSGRVRGALLFFVLLAVLSSGSGLAAGLAGESNGERPQRRGQGWLRDKMRGALTDRLEKKAAEQWEAKLPAGRVQRQTIRHGGMTRQYFVFTPANAPAGRLPLVMYFHGGGGNARGGLAHSGLCATADSFGFLLVALDGTGRTGDVLHTWNVGFGFGSAEEENIDDIGFVAAMLAELKTKHAIDDSRIFATGISNGGILCHFLAADPRIGLAAIAPIVGTVGGYKVDGSQAIKPPAPARPVAVLAINGRTDEHVPLLGGLQQKSVTSPRRMLSASDTVQFWVQANGCQTTPVTTFAAEKNTTYVKFAGGRNATEVVLAIVENQGHAWPGAAGPGWAGGDAPSPTYDANTEMWKFFCAHPRR